MDGNKLAALKKVEWRVIQTCANCRHREPTFKGDWGGCRKVSYHHNKHRKTYPIPAHIMAICNLWEENDSYEELRSFLSSKITS